MSARFIIQFFFSVLFGFIFSDIYVRHATLAVFIVAVMIAQMYIQIMESQKKTRIQVIPKKVSNFAEQMQKFKK